MTTTGLPQLTERAADLVDWLARYGVLLPTIAARRYSHLSSEALRKFLQRLADDGWLTRHELPGAGGSYWVLSTRACHRLNLKRNGNALRHLPLIRHCLTAIFFSENEHLKLLKPNECREMLPAVFRRGSSGRYFLNVGDAANLRLGWLLVDDGKAPLRIWIKSRQTAVTKKQIPALLELCHSGNFYFSVVTTTEAKAEKLRKIFKDRPLQHLAVEVVPVICGLSAELAAFRKVT